MEINNGKKSALKKVDKLSDVFFIVESENTRCIKKKKQKEQEKKSI